MPPRRGGRGRGRTRPPAVIRESMQEIGMGSVATYEAMARLAAAENANASRAYFPPLRDVQKTKPKPLMPNERCLVDLAVQIAAAIARSPHAVRPRKPPVDGGLAAQLSTLQAYYFAKKGNKGPVQDPGAENAVAGKEGAAAHTSAEKHPENGKESDSPADDDVHIDDLWDLDKCWIIPETLPEELRPPKLRGRTEQPPSKRRRVDSDSQNADAGTNIGSNVKDILEKAPEGDGDTGADATQAGDNRDEDGDDADQMDAVAAAQVEDDEDLELETDYQTGARFDDDDGYEEHDSGAEEATF